MLDDIVGPSFSNQKPGCQAPIPSKIRRGDKKLITDPAFSDELLVKMKIIQ